jgi:HSP20 family protein
MNLIRLHRPELWETPTWNRLSDLRDQIDQLFESPRSTDESEFFGWTPALDVFEDQDHLIVKVELPGMNKEALEVSLHQQCLTIAGERREEQLPDKADQSRSERVFGRFQRSFRLTKAVQADKVKASYKDGILTVTLPKTEEFKPKKIEVKS